VTAVFDGHNDALGELQEAGDPPERFLAGLPDRDVDLPRARAGGLAGGLFAVHMKSPPNESESVWEMADAGPVGHAEATAVAISTVGIAHAMAASSNGAVEIVTDVAGLDRCIAGEALGIVLSLEGAEPIDTGLTALDGWYAAGIRSVGLVWSRPSAFGFGVPFRFPASPDTGPGLTDAGLALVRRCADLGIAVDVSHLNEAGFWDLARMELGPIVASHSAAHALCPASRNLTDAQLDAIRDSGGLVGIVFACPFLRRDFADDPDTPIELIAEHARYVADRIGVEHVALGSDYDGATIPAPLGDVAGTPKLLDVLRTAGFGEEDLSAIGWDNWRRGLTAWWS
jgi:membrane dipeptidase